MNRVETVDAEHCSASTVFLRIKKYGIIVYKQIYAQKQT